MGKPIRHRGKWRIRWIDERGVRRSEVYDNLNDAKFQLGKHQQVAGEVRRGLRRPTPTDHTFGELCDYWLTKRNILKRSRKDDESIIRRHLRPAFGQLLIQEISVERVDSFSAERGHLHKNTIAHLLTLLISLLNVAVELGWLAKAPTIRKPRVRVLSKNFRYLKNEEELGRFLRAAHEEGEAAFALYATAVYTGMRQGELAGLHWEDVDFETRLITVQRSFDGPTKADDIRYVPILDPLLPVLKAWRRLNPGILVFINRAGKMLLPSGRIFDQGLHRILKKAEFGEVVDDAGTKRRYIVFHDLRHTFASHWVLNGGDLFKLQKILGHKTVQMTWRYAHLAPAAFAADHSRLGSGSPLQKVEKHPVPKPVPQDGQFPASTRRTLH